MRRKLFNRLYHRARQRAVSKLVIEHKDEFNRLFDAELVAVARDEDAMAFVRAVHLERNGDDAVDQEEPAGVATA